jgi:tetratricopeptide (TPR) repeat protein
VSLLLTLALALLLPQTRRWMHDSVWLPVPNIRLAILPVDGADAEKSAPGILQDAADRISHLQSPSRTVAVFLPGKVADMQIHTPLDARNILHATHALQTTMRREGESLEVNVSLIDLETQAHIREVSHRYTPATVGALPSALAGEISVGLGLPNAATKETLSPAATALYDQGLYLLLDGRSTDESIRLFSESSHLDPGSLIPLTALVEAELKKFESSKDPADISQAQAYLQMAKSLNPDSVKVHLAEGRLAEATGKFEKALESYLRIKELEPNNIDAFVHVAGVYDKLDMPERAIQEYRKAIQLDPDFYEAYQYFGVFYYFRGKYSDAAEQFRKVIERAPRMYRAYMNLDASLEALGRYEEAEQVLRKSFRLGPTAGALNNMGALLASEHRDEEAVVYSQRAVELSPSDYLYRLNLADSYRRLGRIVEAQAEYRKALDSARSELKQNPESGYVRAFVAYFSVRLGDRHRAEDEIAQALQSSPGNARVILRAVLTYEALGLRQQAMSILSSATAELLREIDRDPDLADFSQDLRFKRLVAGISR